MDRSDRCSGAVSVCRVEPEVTSSHRQERKSVGKVGLSTTKLLEVGQKLVMWPHLTKREAEKCHFYALINLGNEAEEYYLAPLPQEGGKNEDGVMDSRFQPQFKSLSAQVTHIQYFPHRLLIHYYEKYFKVASPAAFNSKFKIPG